MVGREHQRNIRRDEEGPEPPAPEAAPTAQDRDEAVDSLLEEIDEVLELNAESFVRGFVQKGGQ